MSQFAQSQFAPHLHDGPQLQALALVAHLQVGVQVQGLHLQVSVIGELLLFGLWRSWDTTRIGWTLERSGYFESACRAFKLATYAMTQAG